LVIGKCSHCSPVGLLPVAVASAVFYSLASNNPRLNLIELQGGSRMAIMAIRYSQSIFQRTFGRIHFDEPPFFLFSAHAAKKLRIDSDKCQVSCILASCLMSYIYPWMHGHLSIYRTVQTETLRLINGRHITVSKQPRNEFVRGACETTWRRREQRAIDRQLRYRDDSM
jgi:hypothetical protein